MKPIDRILLIMKERHITAKQISEATGIKSSSFTGWKKGDYDHSYGSVVKIADYFHIPVDYLLTGKEQKKENPQADKPEDEIDLNNINFALSGEVHDLTEGEKQDVLNFVKFVKAQRKLNKSKKEGGDNG